jgi:arylsulfatase A-like enzyme
MNKTLFSLCIGVGFFSGCQEKPKDSGGRPNVLFIAIDDMNDWVGGMGWREGVLTPNLDRLVSEGVLFTNAHCVAPASSPSRASVMTGVRPSTSGVYANHHDWRLAPALESAKTLPEYFKEIGYIVKGGGKLFHGLCWIQTSYGVDQNDPSLWDEYFPSRQRSIPRAIYPEPVYEDSLGTISWQTMAGADTENRPSWFFDYGPLGEDEQMADYQVIDWAVSELKKDHDKPLFLGVGIYRPHIPWFVPQKYFDLYPLDEIKLPEIIDNDLDDVSEIAHSWLRRGWQEWMIQNNQWEEAVRAYQASISFADAMLGRLIDGLKESGKFDNTIIVLWSDHGMHIGEKEHWEKFTLWERSTRVPLAIVGPGVKRGSSSNQAVSLLDIFPTLVELTENQPFDQLEGESLLPLLKDPGAIKVSPAITTWHFGNHAVRSERWRYISYHNGDEELYDHENDRNEFYNLAKDPSYRDLMDSLKQWLPQVNVEPIY